MSKRKRWVIAIIVGLVLIGVGVLSLSSGYLFGAMGSDSCTASNIPDWTVYILYTLPFTMLIGSLVPPVFIVMGKRWYWPVLAFVLFGLLNSGIFAFWFFGILNA